MLVGAPIDGRGAHQDCEAICSASGTPAIALIRYADLPQGAILCADCGVLQGGKRRATPGLELPRTPRRRQPTVPDSLSRFPHRHPWLGRTQNRCSLRNTTLVIKIAEATLWIYAPVQLLVSLWPLLTEGRCWRAPAPMPPVQGPSSSQLDGPRVSHQHSRRSRLVCLPTLEEEVEFRLQS